MEVGKWIEIMVKTRLFQLQLPSPSQESTGGQCHSLGTKERSSPDENRWRKHESSVLFGIVIINSDIRMEENGSMSEQLM